MESEKKEIFVSKAKKNKEFMGLFVKSDNFKLLILSVIILYIIWGFYKSFDQSAADIGIIISIMIFLLSMFAVKSNSVIKRFIVFLLFIISVIFIRNFFVNSGVNFPDIILFVIAFSILSVSLVTLTKIVEDTKNTKTSLTRINSASELIKFSLKSDNFYFLLFLMFWLFFFTAISAIIGVYGIGIILFFIDASIISFLIIFIGMILSTRKIKKSGLSILSFAMITIISIPLCMIIFFKLLILLNN